MKVKIYTDSIDSLSAALLVLPFFADSKPLKGVAGIVDWRLNGFVSQLIMTNKLSGKYFEKVLLPPMERIPTERVLLIGLGRSDELNQERMTDFAYRLMETVHKISFSNFLTTLPVEFEKIRTLKQIIEGYFKGIDKFAVKIGQCEFLEDLRIIFVLDKAKCPLVIESLSSYLSSRRVISQALINA